MAIEGYQRIKSLIQQLLIKQEAGGLRYILAKAAAGTFGLKVVATGLSLIVNLLLARLLGLADYGAYTYAMAWVSLLGIPAVLGLDTLLVRNIAAYQAQSAWDMMRGILIWANQVVLFVSVGLALLTGILTWYLAGHLDPQVLPTLWVALFVLPLMAMTRVRQAAMQGLSHVVTGQMPEMLIRPVLFLGFIGVAYLVVGKGLRAPWAMGMNVAATGAAFCIGAYMLYKTVPKTVKKAFPVYQSRAWVQSALPLIVIGGMNAVHSYTDILMLGAIQGAALAGIYTVVNYGADLIVFILRAVNAALAPTIANLYAVGDLKRLQHVITKSARVTLFVSLPLALVFIFLGHWLLLIFGKEFTQGQTALAILSLGQLVNASMGSAGLLLIMTGYERDAATGIGFSAVMNVVLNSLLIPKMGLAGAALATTITVIGWNVYKVYLAHKLLKINSTVFNFNKLRSFRGRF